MLRFLQRPAVISGRIERGLLERRIPWRGDHGFPMNAVSLNATTA